MFLVFQSKRTLCYLIWAKREKNAGLLMLETFYLATDSGLSLCLSKDSLIRLSKNGALLHCKEEEEKKSMRSIEISETVLVLRSILVLLMQNASETI